jgi:hypothetical protein
MIISDKHILYLMAAISGAALVCYTLVWRLCGLEVKEPQEERRHTLRRLATAAHLLDWAMNVLVATVGVGRLFRDENFGGQHQPRWLKIYFMISGPLPTLGMLGAIITGHRWGAQLATDARKRRIHRVSAWIGYLSWWFSYLPIFAQPLLNRIAQRRRDTVTG